MSIVIVGAGPNLGLAVGRRFGREGLAVGLVSRTQAKLDDLAVQLESEGIAAAGAAADIRESDALAAAIASLAERLGAVEVLEYSPLPAPEFMKPIWQAGLAAPPGGLEDLFAIIGPRTMEQLDSQLLIEPGAVGTELTDHITHSETKQGVEQFYAATAITADDISQIIAFAVSRPHSVSLNEILVRPTAQVG